MSKTKLPKGALAPDMNLKKIADEKARIKDVLEVKALEEVLKAKELEEVLEVKALEKGLEEDMEVDEVLCNILQERTTRREVNSLLDTIFYLLVFINAEKLVNSYELLEALSPHDFNKGEYGTTVRQLVNDFVDN